MSSDVRILPGTPKSRLLPVRISNKEKEENWSQANKLYSFNKFALLLTQNKQTTGLQKHTCKDEKKDIT